MYYMMNNPNLQYMSVLYMTFSSTDVLLEQFLDLDLYRAFLADPLPGDAAAFRRRIEEGRGRLTLIAHEIARSALQVLTEHAAAARKLKDTRPAKETADDIQAQLARLVPRRFLAETPWPQLAQLPRYLKGIA